MIRDFADPATPTAFEADVVIAGSGPAAIPLARSLGAAGHRVLMLEAGGLTFEEESQELYKGRNLGWDYPIQWSRLRQFGGTTGHWQGQSGRLHPVDVSGAPGRPAWPVEHAEIARWYGPAADFLDVSRTPDAAILAGLPRELPGRRLFNHVWHWSKDVPVRLGEREEPVLRADPSIELLVHAAVTGVSAVDPDGTVRGFRFRTRDGRVGEARGRRLVLACGGLENARLLEVMRRAGLPIPAASAGYLGRYLQEHLSLSPARLSTSDAGEKLVAAATHPVHGGGGVSLPAVSTPPQVLKDTGAGGSYFRFWHLDAEWARLPGRPLRPNSLLERLPYYAAQYDEITFERLAFRHPELFRRDQLRPPVQLFIEMEQLPDQRNRVQLGRDVDAVGLPVLEVDMQPRDRDAMTMKAAIDHFARASIAEGLGRVALMDWAVDPLSLPAAWEWSWHHNGTTRMSRRAEDGVVDPEHLLFGTRNLHVAGASVFPSSGFANPTLTIVAMSMRLGELLKARLTG